MANRVKIGLLGAGHLGKIHLKCIREVTDMELVGFHDSDPAVAENVAAEYGARAFESADALIEASDAVDIVTPTLHHYNLACRAIKKSRHVFIEKPITETVEEARALLSLAKEAQVKVQVGHVERFNPAYLAARDYFTHPLFIETHRLAQFNPRGTDVSVVLDLMIHDIDIVLSIVKSNIRKISASGVSVVSDSPDITNARIEFDNGAVANLTASRISMKNMRKTRVFQKDAYISLDFLEKSLNIIRLSEVEGEPDPLAVIIEPGPGKKPKQIWFENPKTEPVNAIRLELEAFSKAVLNDTPTPVSPEDGLAALEVAHKIIEKIRLNSDFSPEPTISR
ncbi:MAG: Gfo/Idh/MocA family oxidoreductase [Bacteroidia bacterium]|nr:Gfo/Idh/MocA family oxidoreductase [Bacteroidia bacterium]